MSANKFEPNDLHAHTSDNTILAYFESDIKIVISMFHFIFEGIVLTITLTINPHQSQTHRILEEQPHNCTLLFG